MKPFVDVSFRHPTQPIVEAILHVRGAAALSGSTPRGHDGLSEQPRDELLVNRRHLDVARGGTRAYVGEHRIDTEQKQQCDARALHEMVELPTAAWPSHMALGIEFRYVDAEFVLTLCRSGERQTGPGRQIGLLDQESADALRQ